MSQNWSSKRVLVTGATGLVGSWLVASLLEKGAYVVGLIRDLDPQSELLRSKNIERIAVVNGRLEDFDDCERPLVEHDIDTVFHLGAQTIVGTALRSPLATFDSNIKGSYNLLEACRRQSGLVKRVVVASSDKAYGEVASLPYDETMPPIGKHPYDVSKSCTDLLAQTYAHTYGTPVVIARCGNIYGGGDLNWSRIVPGTIKSLLNGQAPIIRSDGTFLRDYVYVEDAAAAYMRMAEAMDEMPLTGEAFNFGPSEPKSVIDLVKMLQKVMGREDIEPQIQSTAKAEIKDQYLDSRKAAEMLGIRPKEDLATGLAKTVDWYKNILGAA